MDAELSAPEIVSSSPGSSLSLASNDDSRLITSSVSEHALKDDENGKTNGSENGEALFEADPFVSDISDAPFVGSDGSNVILKDGYLGGGDNGVDEFRGEGSMEKPDFGSVGNGDKEDKVEMSSVVEADQSVSSMEKPDFGSVGNGGQEDKVEMSSVVEADQSVSSMEKPDFGSVGNGGKEDKVEMSSVVEADQSVSSMEKPDFGSVGNGDKEDKVEMSSVVEANQSVSSKENVEGGGIGVVENNLVIGDGPKLVNPMIAEGGDYKVLEADVPKFSSGEDLAGDATPLTGDALGIQTSETKEAEGASLDSGFNQLTHEATDGIETTEVLAPEQTSEIDPERKANADSGSLPGKDDSGTEMNNLKEEAGIDMLEQASTDNIDGGGGDGIRPMDHSSQPTEMMAAHEMENSDSDFHSKRSITTAVEESHSPKSVKQTTVSEGEMEETHHQNQGIEIEGSDTDGETEGMFFETAESAEQFLEELERGSAIASHSGADTSQDHSQTIDGQIVSDSDEEGNTDEEGEGKELFDSAALVALLKAASGGGSDGSDITITSQDGSRLFSVERPAGLGSSLQNARSASRPNRPNIFSPSVVTSQRDSNLSEEDKIKLEKLQLIRVKFLRLVQRLRLSTEDSIAAQVLYRLALVAGRQTSELFSVDSAKRKALELETEGKDDLSFSINILVLGKIGVGKSATINSIFGEVKTSIDAFEPATAVVKEITGIIDGVKLRIIDTPGLRASAMEQGANRKVLASIQQFIKKCPPDVVVYVDRLDTQTRDLNDLPLLRSITNSLGSSIWKNALIALTHAASAPPEGPSGSPLSYEVFVAQRSHVVQQSVAQAVGDLRMMNPSLMNPVCLVENHPSCRKNRDGQKVLPNGQTWRPQLLLLCYSIKVLSEANSISKPQDPFDHRKLFGFRVRSPPLPYLLSWLLQSRSHPKLSTDQGGENGDSDIEMADLSDSDQEEDEDEYDRLPPFKPLRKVQLGKLTKEQRKAYFEEYDYRVKLLQKKQWREELRKMREMKKGKPSVDEYGNMGEDVDQENGGPAAVPVPLPDMVLPPSFDANNPAYRYRFLEPTNQFMARPVLDTHGWDHDCGYDGVNVEHSLAIASQFPAAVSVQLTKDKKEFNIHLDSSVSAKHGENGSSMAGFDIQNVGKQLAYVFRGETKFKNLKKNKTAAGFSVTFLGENVAPGLKLEDHIVVGKRLVLVGSTGTVRSKGDAAYGANLEIQLRDTDFPIGQDQSSLGLSLVKWRGDLALGANFQSQISVGRSSKIAVRAGLNNKMSGQITVRTSSSDQLQIAFAGILPIALAIYKRMRPGVGDNYSMY